MKLTIVIPDAHAGDLIQFIAGLTAKPVEVTTDPAPGHPELPLVPAEDITRRDLPFPNGLTPPPLPKGKTRWIYRGRGFGYEGIPVGDRVVFYDSGEGRWHDTDRFSCDFIHHIEAV